MLSENHRVHYEFFCVQQSDPPRFFQTCLMLGEPLHNVDITQDTPQHNAQTTVQHSRKVHC